MRWVLVLGLGLLILGSAAHAATTRSPAEQRGKALYLHGTSLAGRPVIAIVGPGALHIPGASLPCAGCHGADGRGKPEGGVVPPDITWTGLTKPYPVTLAGGRTRPGYTAESMVRAITDGRDSGGNRLLPPMPRYRMAAEDAADLVAYLRRLEDDRDPGIGETRVTLGVLLPGTGPLAPTGRAVAALLAAYTERLNEPGGIHGRRIQLVAVEAERGEGPAALDRLLAAEPLALIGVAPETVDAEVLSRVKQEAVPLLALPFPPADAPAGGPVFYLLSGLVEQGQTLLRFAEQRRGGARGPLGIVGPAEATLARVSAALAGHARQRGWTPVVREYAAGRFDAGRLVEELSRAHAEVVMFLGSGREMASFVKEAEQREWWPLVLMPAGLATRDVAEVPHALQERVFLALPTSPADHTAAALQTYKELARAADLPSWPGLPLLIAQGGATVLLEALKRAGRDLSREKLIAALEGLYEYPTGLIPPVTYGPNRRIGALGAHIVALRAGERRFASLGFLAPE